MKRFHLLSAQGKERLWWLYSLLPKRPETLFLVGTVQQIRRATRAQSVLSLDAYLSTGSSSGREEARGGFRLEAFSPVAIEDIFHIKKPGPAVFSISVDLLCFLSALSLIS